MHTLAVNYIFFSLLLFLFLSKRGFKAINRKEDILFIALSFIVLAILHVFVDINSVEDLPGYQSGFKSIERTRYPYYLNEFRKGDVLYAVLNKAVGTITDDFYFFLLLYNILLLGSHYYIFKKYSPSVPVSVIIFLALFFNQSLFVVRQYIAISILILSIPFIIEKKIIPFILLCILAFLNHSSALLFVPLFVLYNVNNKKVLLALVVLIFSFSSVLTTNFGLNLISYVGYDEYIDLTAESNLTAKMIPISYLVIYVLALRRHILDEGMNRLCFIGIFLYALGYAFAPGVGLISRILKYYELFVMFAVPITVQYMKKPIIRFFYLLAVVAFQGYLTIRNLSEFYFVDYRTVPINFLYFIILIMVDIFIVMKFKNKLRIQSR